MGDEMWCCDSYYYSFAVHLQINDGFPCENSLWIADYLFDCFGGQGN